MRRLTIIGAAILAALALSVVAASAASAANPEFLKFAKPKFTATSPKGKLQIKGGGAIACAKDEVKTGNGEITGAKTVKLNVDFLECEALGLPANSLGDAAKTILFKGTGTLCYVSAAKKEVALKIILTEEVHIEVPEAGTLLLVKGTVYGAVTPVNEANTAGKISFAQAAGKQTLNKCEGEAEGNLSTSENGKAAVQSGLESVESITFEEKVEVMA
jgi:hypothetical protein